MSSMTRCCYPTLLTCITHSESQLANSCCMQCFTESMVACLAKDCEFMLDLGKLSRSDDFMELDDERFSIANIENEDFEDVESEITSKFHLINAAGRVGRSPPVSPASFAVQLEKKTFTGRADIETVLNLYNDSFEQYISRSTSLAFSNLGWGDKQLEEVRIVTAAAHHTLPC